jgi:hypothetical protein
MTARLTEREARALGITATGTPAPSTSSKGRRLRALYASTCHACGEPFTAEAAELRHSAATGHRRFDWHDQ